MGVPRRFLLRERDRDRLRLQRQWEPALSRNQATCSNPHNPFVFFLVEKESSLRTCRNPTWSGNPTVDSVDVSDTYVNTRGNNLAQVQTCRSHLDVFTGQIATTPGSQFNLRVQLPRTVNSTEPKRKIDLKKGGVIQGAGVGVFGDGFMRQCAG